MSSKVRPLALALALAFGAIAPLLTPGVAAAASHHRAHHDSASYPMKADEFRQLMEKRIDAVRAAIDRKLDKRGVSSDRKKAIHRVFDEASKDLRDQINRAAASGTVTRADAEKAKTLATGLRARVRERLRAEKSPKLKEKLARADAAKKDRAAHTKAPASGDHPGGRAGASPDDPPAGHPKPNHAPPAAKTKKAKASPADAPASGPTRTAKAPAKKKHKQPKVDPGAL
jgi:hypothetical protein